MKKILFVLLIVSISSCQDSHQRQVNDLQLHPTSVANPAVIPVSRSPGSSLGGEKGWWFKCHKAINERVKRGDVDLLFIGDSITHQWNMKDRSRMCPGIEGVEDAIDIWERYYGTRKAVNIGIGADRTQHVLWRLDHGNIDHISPKIAVILIGTNNFSDGQTLQQVAEGILAIVCKLRHRLPHTKLLLLGIFPRGAKPDSLREKIIHTNRIIAKYADEKMIHYLDIGNKFLSNDGTFLREYTFDNLHLTRKGYELWAESMEPIIVQLLMDSDIQS